jgi:hypothetical protein
MAQGVDSEYISPWTFYCLRLRALNLSTQN